MCHVCLDDAESLLPKHHILKDIKIFTKLRFFWTWTSKYNVWFHKSLLITFLHKEMKTSQDGKSTASFTWFGYNCKDTWFQVFQTRPLPPTLLFIYQLIGRIQEASRSTSDLKSLFITKWTDSKEDCIYYLPGK